MNVFWCLILAWNGLHYCRASGCVGPSGVPGCLDAWISGSPDHWITEIAEILLVR